MHRFVAFLATAVLALVACDMSTGAAATPIDGHPTTLAGTSWTVMAIDGIQPPRGGQPVIAFDATTAKGSGGCNHFGESYRYDPRTGELRFHDTGMTAMACAEPHRNGVETRFIQLLGQRPLVAVLGSDGELALIGAAGRIDLTPAGPAVTD